MNLNTRVKNLESAHSRQASGASYKDEWLAVFDQFGLPADTPIPNHMPVIRVMVSPDGTEGSHLLRMAGKTYECTP